MLFYEANESKNKNGYLFYDNHVEIQTIAEHLPLEIGTCGTWPHGWNCENLINCVTLCDRQDLAHFASLPWPNLLSLLTRNRNEENDKKEKKEMTCAWCVVLPGAFALKFTVI